MEIKPLVSVIVPTYNREKLIPQAIDSVLAQTYKNWELIIVDDRSTDGTKELVKKYIEKDNRIKYILNTHNQGPSGARNQGLEIAKGEYIAFLDSDDVWRKNHLKDAIWFFKNSKVDFIFADCEEKGILQNKIISDCSDLVEFRLSIPHRVIKKDFIIYKKSIFREILKNNFITTQTTVIKKKKINIRFDENLKNGEDGDFWMRFIKKNNNIGYINKVKCTVRVHDNNISGRSLNKKNTILVIDDLIRRDKKQLKIAPEYKKIIKKKISRSYFNKGYFYRRDKKLKALINYMKAIYYSYNPIQLKAIKKLFIPGYYK